MSRSWPIGLAILTLRGAIANYEEQQTTEALLSLKHATWKAERNLTPFRKSKIRHIFEEDYLRSLNKEIHTAKKLIWGR